jgi:hypothetical protein
MNQEQILQKIRNEKQEYRRLNNLLNSDEKVLQMRDFILSNRTQYPPLVSHPMSLIKSQMFNVVNNNLIYVPKNLRYVLQNDIQPLLQQLYDDDTQGLGRGQQAFYETVCSRYLGISRTNVIQFLRTQKWYNITRGKKRNKRYSLPVYQYPRQAYALDLIDMTYFNNPYGYKYIITCVDLFSKYVILGRLTNKEAGTITNWFRENIINAGLRPEKLFSDNGSELRNRPFNQLCVQNNIQRVFQPPHHPQKNVEAMNYNIRRLLKHLFTKNGDTHWYDQLDVIQNSLNNYRSKRNGSFTPAQIFNANDPNINLEILERTKESKRNKGDMPEPQYALNQRVHVSLIALNNAIAKKNKDGELKNVAIIWSPEVFRVNRIIPASEDNRGHYRYEITNLAGQRLANNTNNAKEFLESDLQDAEIEQPPEGGEYNYNQMMTLINRIPNPLGFKYMNNNMN